MEVLMERYMKRQHKLATGMLVLAFCASFSFAVEWKLYPGASLDQQATRESQEMAAAAKMTNVRSTIYTTADSFSKVSAFYKAIAKEYPMPRSSGTAGKPKKHEGYDLWEAYFIFDGAKELSASKFWVKVQRPYIGEDVRDVTAIIVTEKK